MLHGRRSFELHKCMRRPRVAVNPLQNVYSSASAAQEGWKGKILTVSYMVDSLGFKSLKKEDTENVISYFLILKFLQLGTLCLNREGENPRSYTDVFILLLLVIQGLRRHCSRQDHTVSYMMPWSAFPFYFPLSLLFCLCRWAV